MHFFSAVHLLCIFLPAKVVLSFELYFNNFLGVGDGPALRFANLLDIEALLRRVGGTAFVCFLREFFLIDD